MSFCLHRVWLRMDRQRSSCHKSICRLLLHQKQNAPLTHTQPPVGFSLCSTKQANPVHVWSAVHPRKQCFFVSKNTLMETNPNRFPVVFAMRITTARHASMHWSVSSSVWCAHHASCWTYACGPGHRFADIFSAWSACSVVVLCIWTRACLDDGRPCGWIMDLETICKHIQKTARWASLETLTRLLYTTQQHAQAYHHIDCMPVVTSMVRDQAEALAVLPMHMHICLCSDALTQHDALRSISRTKQTNQQHSVRWRRRRIFWTPMFCHILSAQTWRCSIWLIWLAFCWTTCSCRRREGASSTTILRYMISLLEFWHVNGTSHVW